MTSLDKSGYLNSLWIINDLNRPETKLLVTNGLSHPYHLDESVVNFRGTRCIFSFAYLFSMKIL